MRLLEPFWSLGNRRMAKRKKGNESSDVK